jgi:hypothetical protein
VFDRWWNEDCILDPDANLLMTDLWGSYISWLSAYNVDPLMAGGRAKFQERVAAKGGKPFRTRRARRIAGVRPRYLFGERPTDWTYEHATVDASGPEAGPAVT